MSSVDLRQARCHRFNLSILECKWRVHHGNAAQLTVLVYPYWNVNISISTIYVHTAGFNLSILECCKLQTMTAVVHFHLRFNLSILKCKSNCVDFLILPWIVLIYPYWNVNRFGIVPATLLPRVLIYPYWNANDTIPETFTKRVFDTQWDGWYTIFIS